MSRAEALSQWERIAAGHLRTELEDVGFDELHLWIREIAAAVVLADSVHRKFRPGEIVRAVGLFGHKDPNAKARKATKVLDEFPFLDKDGGERKPRHGEKMSAVVKTARAHQPNRSGSTDEEIKKSIKLRP